MLAQIRPRAQGYHWVLKLMAVGYRRRPGIRVGDRLCALCSASGKQPSGWEVEWNETVHRIQGSAAC